MLKKRTIKNILLEVEASCCNYEEYLQEIIDIVFNDNNNDVKYIIARENNYNCLCLYKYSEKGYISWLCNDYNIEDLSELKNNYSFVYEYVQKNYIDYYIEKDITNFISISKFRNMLYNNKMLLQQVINNIFTNLRNCKDNKYLTNGYNLNKKLYHELLKIKKGLK